MVYVFDIRMRLRRPAGVLLIVPFAGLLAILILKVYQHLDYGLGFDYQGHLDYVRYIDFTARLPLADRGWQMYHPPAYYVTTALVFEALHRIGLPLTLTDAGRLLSCFAWIVQGIAAVIAVRALGGGWVGASAAAALVWLLPGQAMMGTMVYNETFTGLGVALVTLGVILWQRDHPRWGLPMLALGLLIAMLSKYSGLTAAVIAIPIIVRIGAHRLRWTLAALAPGLVLGLVFYLRNLLVFGTPVPLNAELFKLQTWDPYGWGHPAGFFTSFSMQPCAARSSFWAGLWKWFWAQDCFVQHWPDRVAGLVLAGAIVATVVVGLAFLGNAWRGLRDPVLLLLAAIPAAVFLAFLAYNLRVPSATTDKGVYILCALMPVAVALGLFVDRLRHRLAAAAAYALILGWAVVMVFASGLG